MGALQNVLASVIPTIGPAIQDALTQRGGLFPFVNTDFAQDAQQQGDTINVTFPVALTAQAVVASPSGSANAGITPTQTSLVLDQWFEAGFSLTHKQQQEIGSFPSWFGEQIVEAVNGLYIQMDTSFTSASIAAAKDTGGTYGFGFSGSNATDSLTGSLEIFAHANRILMDNKAPTANRTMLLSPAAAENYRLNQQLQKVNEAGSAALLREGSLGRIMRFDVFESNFSVADSLGSGSVSLAIQRNALGVAVRPGNSGDGTAIIVDPVSGAPLTLTVFQQEYQVKWTLSALWGVAPIRDSFIYAFTDDF